MNKVIKFFFLILGFFTGFGLIFGSGWHIANEIFPGTFQAGNYSFINSRIGVGIEDPVQLLHIYDSSNAVRILIQSNLTNGNSYVRAQNDVKYYDFGINGGTGDSFQIRNSTSVLFTLRNGNIGIGSGKFNPQAKLDVEGSIYAQELCDETGANCQDLSEGGSASYMVGGLYGICNFHTNGFCMSATAPAICSTPYSTPCSCSSGFTLVRTGQNAIDNNYIYYTCIKN